MNLTSKESVNGFQRKTFNFIKNGLTQPSPLFIGLHFGYQKLCLVSISLVEVAERYP